MATKKTKMSFKFKIVVAACAIVVISAIVDSIKMMREFESRKAETLTLFDGFVSQLNDAISAQFFERYGDVQAFAVNPVFQNLSDAASIAQTLNKYVALYGIYDVILYVDAQGHFVASNTLAADGTKLNWESLSTLNFSDQEWFRAVSNARYTVDEADGLGRTYVEDLQIDPISSAVYGKKMYGNGFASRVEDANGKFHGVLVTRANAVWIEGEMVNVFHRAKSKGYSSIEVHLLDKQGVMLADYDPGKTDLNVQRDFNVLKKENLLEKQVPGVRELLERKSGHFVGQNPDREMKEQIVAYRPVESKKFIESIGWGVIVTALSDEVFAPLERSKRLLLIVSLVSVMVFGLSGYFFASSLSKKFTLVSDKLKETAEHTSKMASKLANSSRSVAEASGEQSAAVQETVSSMAEISSMISQTNQNLRECTDIASKVSNKSEQGNQIMSRLATAMDAVSNSNHQLQSIANIISEVSAKTMVINDIVFKTQLLSINASIEAARAGQHGKGFSVVAEEVGNLAQMSGNAAKEIQLLIADSHKAVQQIIEVTQARTSESQTVSSEALGAFSEIASGVQAINERLQGVAQATKEQELGISQITVAMNQMDQSTQRNSSIAGESAELVKVLASVSERNYKIMRALRTLVVGSETSQASRHQDIIEKIIGESEESSNEGHEGNDRDSGGYVSKPGVLHDLKERIGKKLHSSKQEQRSDPFVGDTAVHETDMSADDESFKKSA